MISNWDTVPFSDIADFKNGLNFKSGETGHALKVLGVGDFHNRSFLDQVDEISTIHTEKEIDSSYHLQDGDLIFVRSNGNKALVGRCMLVRNIKEKISFSGFTIRARLTMSDVLPAFINLLMQAGVLRKKLKRDGRGTNISNLNQGMLSKIEIPLFSIDQQREILDFFSNWDKAIEKIEALIDAKERQFGWLQKSLIGEEFKPYNSRLFEYANILKQQKIDKIGELKPLIVKLHCKGIEPNERKVQITLSKKGRPYYQRFAGEFLIGRQNFHNGGFGIVPSYLDGFIASNAITSLEIDESKLVPSYLFYFFSRKDYYRRIGHVMDGTGQKELSDKELMKLTVSIPSIQRQKEIVAILDTAQQEITLLKKLADQYRTQKRGLMQKLLSGKWHIKNKDAT